VPGLNNIKACARLALAEDRLACGKMPWHSPLNQKRKFRFCEPRKNGDFRQRLTVVDFDFRHGAYFTGGKPAEMGAAANRSLVRITKLPKVAAGIAYGLKEAIRRAPRI